MTIKEVVWTRQFEHDIKSVKDKATKERIRKQIEKIIKTPSTGKPLRYNLKGERTMYIGHFRLIYASDSEKLYLLKFEHRKKVY